MADDDRERRVYEGDQSELRYTAREQAIECCQKWWDSFAVDDADYDGAIVTGFIVISEAVLPNGYPSIAFFSGNGMPPRSDGITGLPEHRAEGMLRHTLRKIR